jgi:hypothetical protein
MKVHRGRPQANRATAVGRLSLSSAAAEKKPATQCAFKVTRSAISAAGRMVTRKAALTAPCAVSSSSVGTMRWRALVSDRSTRFSAKLIEAQSAT